MMASARLRILVLIDQRQGFQNFVAHGAFEALAARHDLFYASTPADEEAMGLDPRDFVGTARWESVEVDPVRVARWKQLAFLAQIRPALSPYRRRLRRMRLRPIPRRRRLFLTLLALPGPRWIYSTLLLRRLLAVPHRRLAALLDRHRPHVVLLPSALNGPLLNDALLECRRRGITSVVLMNSWDNPSTKNATYVPPDWLLVWGEQTRRHAIDYMGLPPEKVVPFGAPQMEFLRSADVAAARRGFRAAYGMAESDLVILYAASSIRTGDFDALHALETAIARGDLPPCRIVYRTYPGMAGRDLDRICKHRWNFVTVQRRDDAGGAERGSSGKAEGKLGALAAADAVISPLSTILVEAAMLGRPVLCYFPQALAAAKFRRSNAPLVHFDDLLALPEVVVADEAAQLVPATKVLLGRVGLPDLAERLRMHSRHFVDDAPDYARRLAGFVEAVTAEAEPQPSASATHIGALAAAR